MPQTWSASADCEGGVGATHRRSERPTDVGLKPWDLTTGDDQGGT